MNASRFAPLMALILSALSISANATDWWFIPPAQTADADGLAYVDKSSMRRTPGTGNVTGSVWLFFRQEQASEAGPYRSDKSRITLDCEEQQYSADSGSLLSAFGGVVHRYKNEAPAWLPIEPNSDREAMARFMCSDGKQPPRSLPVFDPNRDVEQRFQQLDRERGRGGATTP